MLVAYDGTRFRGFAAQPGQRTVAGALAEAIGRVVQHPVDITCAGRTDRGVHAWGQVIHVDVQPPDDGLDLAALARSCRKQLGPEVVVRAAMPAEEGFDARRSATGRRYRYTIVNREVPDPFLARFAWHVEHPLDRRAMDLACDPLYGEHDFSSFCRRPTPEASLVRRVRQVRWTDVGDGVLRFEIEANAFCHQMVRSVVGTLVDVGLGRKRAGDVAGIVRACDRAKAGQMAPPHGLCLWEVEYPPAAASWSPF
jgi:tRNA pseudouridine38-40 synthase